MNAIPKTLPKVIRGERAIMDPSIRLLDYTAMAEVLGMPSPEAARKAIASIPELHRLKISLGRRARFRESDVRAYLDKLSQTGCHHAG